MQESGEGRGQEHNPGFLLFCLAQLNENLRKQWLVFVLISSDEIKQPVLRRRNKCSREQLSIDRGS